MDDIARIRVGDSVTVSGIVRTIETLVPDGHYRFTVDVPPTPGYAHLTPADEAAINEAVSGRIPEAYGTRSEYVCDIAAGIIVRAVTNAGDTADDTVQLNMSTMDAKFAIKHLRFLVDREDATTPDHAAANLSARWLADQIEEKVNG
jgi:hypothetical protein